MNKLRNLIFVLILLLSIALRFYRLNDVPAGFHQDEVSQAYNAFSIATTGHDRYGEKLPILFRSFGSYQPPVYTYLSTIPMLLFGNSIFSARFLSALAGVLVTVFTYLIVISLSKSHNKYLIGLFSAFVMTISPWAIHFSRRVVEGNVGLAFFLFSLYLFILSLKRIRLFPVAMFILGVATHAYYSERVIGFLFIPLFLFVYRKYYFKYKLLVTIGLLIYFLTQIPHVWILTTGAFSKRFDQVSYFSNDTAGAPKYIFIAREFLKHYMGYISPKNLFADTGSGLARVSPNLGVFYSWMFLPFILGVTYFIKNVKNDFKKIVVILLTTSLVPASLTGDIFYPLRALEFLWLSSLIISMGMLPIYEFLKTRTKRIIVVGFLTIYSLATFYVSYFILFQYETTEYVGASYIKLNNYLDNYKEKKIVIDPARDPAVGLRIAYLRKYSPQKMAENLRPQLSSSYYSSDVSLKEIYRIDNILVRPINWGDERCSPNTIVVGDMLAISDLQAKEHNLTSVFTIDNVDSNATLRGLVTNPNKDQCNK